MSTSHNGGNAIPEITREEHDGTLNAKRISLVSAATISIMGNIGGVFVSTASTWVDGGTGMPRANVRGTILGDLETLIAGEDLTNNVLKVEQRFSSGNVTVAGTTTVKGSAGFLHGVFVGGVSCPTVIVYDNTAASGTNIGYLDPNPPIGFYTLDVTAATGITVNTTPGVAPKITVSYR